MRTYQIRAGNQYDRDGVNVNCDGLWASVSRAQRMDGTVGLCWTGALFPRLADKSAVETAIERVMMSRVAETVTLGEPTVVEMAPAESPMICRKCHSYCYGDCEAN